MIYDYDPRFNRENITSKSASYRLLKDILAHKIADSMANGTASNYLSKSYGPNHRVLFEGVASLLADVMIGSLDNLDDIEYSQLRAEFVATRLMYLVFPNEDSVPVGDNHEETITFLLQTYEALLQGATKRSVDEVLNDIAEGNAVVLSDVEGYITNIRSSILATTEYNSDGVIQKHRHFAFTDESGLGSTNKPIEYQWGDNLHTHDIIDGVIQPHVDAGGRSHTHEVFLGVPENIVRLQSNLRKVFSVTKPAHIKTGEVSSIIDEDIPILAQGKEDVFTPILGLHPTKTDADLIVENTIDTSIPYYNQNALYGQVGLSLGSLYQEEMRRARDGAYEAESYGYVSGKTIRFWRTNIKVADNLTIGSQKLRVISVSERISPESRTYDPITDSNGLLYTYKKVRSLRKGSDPSRHNEDSRSLRVINGCLYPPLDLNSVNTGNIFFQDVLNDGEPVDFVGEIYFCDLMADNLPVDLGVHPQTNDWGHRIRLSYIEVTVDASISLSGLQKINNESSTWRTRDQIAYETVNFEYFSPISLAVSTIYSRDRILLPLDLCKDMLKTINGLPISIHDLEVLVNGQPIDYEYHTVSLSHTNNDVVPLYYGLDPQSLPLMILDVSESVGREAYKALATFGDTITITYPKAKSDIRRFRELNSLSMTLNAVRPARKVSESGRGIGQNRVIETTSPISYVLNEPQPISPYTLDQKIATYSAGSSDLLNTKNQTLNTTYTLNNFSLNQTATQEQVFKPATKTLTTSNPKISFYRLGFRPQFITSVVDSDGLSYAYALNQDHVLVSGLTSEKTLTVSGLSSNPFSADLEWYKGDKLNEGSAFYKHTSTINEPGEILDLGAFTESSPEEYMTNPLGLAPIDPNTGLPRLDPNTGQIIDQIRSVYSMIDTKTSGVEGEMIFYEDEITGYEFKQYEDGRDAFPNEYNPHNPQDELLYQDPTLYILGPLSQVESGPTVNTIPTYLFFGYFMLKDMVGDANLDYYISIYRFENGVKKYQTLTTITDPNGFDALQVSGTLPESNGSPLAYRFQDAGNNFGLEYNDNSSTAYTNASFNHIPNETYYLEVYFEESPSGGASFLGFFSKGSNTNVNLSDTFLNLSQDPNQNEVTFLSGAGNQDVTLTYQVTFTTNPGEIATFSSVADPNLTATKESENVGATFDTTTTTFFAEDYYPQRLLQQGYDQAWQDNFLVGEMTFKEVEDRVPLIGDSHLVPPMRLSPISVNSTVTFTDNLMWSLLLEPAMITETVGEITDEVLARYNYNHIILNDTITFTDEFSFNTQLNLVKVSESDTVPAPSDTLTVPVYQKLVPTSNYPTISDDGFARISSFGVSSSVSTVSDNEIPLLVSYSLIPRSVSSTVPSATDSVLGALSFTPINESDLVSSLSDGESTSFAYTPRSFSSTVPSATDSVLGSYSFLPINESDLIPNLLDGDSTSFSYTPRSESDSTSWGVGHDSATATFSYLPRDLTDSISGISDAITVPVYQTLAPSDLTPTISDALNATLHLYLYDSVDAPSDVAPSGAKGPQETFNFTPISQTDSMITITDSVETSRGFLFLSNYPLITDSENSFISGTTQSDPTSVSVSDTVSTAVRFVPPYLYFGVKYNSFSSPNSSTSDNELFSVYKGSMDTLQYLDITDHQPDNGGLTPVGIVNGTAVVKESYVYANLGNTTYNNPNDDALIAMEIEYDTDYTIYAYSEYVDNGNDIAVAMKAGPKNLSSTNGYVDSLGYTDLMPGNSFGGADRYFLHSFYLNSTTGNIVFTQDSGTNFTFASAQNVRAYFHIKYTYTQNTSDGSDIFKLRPAPTNATTSNPNGDGAVTGGFVLGDLHGSSGIGSNNTNNYHLLPNYSIPNTDNDSQVSWLLAIGTRYHLQLYIDDQSPDFELYLEARTNDSGASASTAYSSSDTLTYTELITNDDDSRIRWDHFFTIRRDGFIIWEQDSGS